ncbi:MarR family winged helix-turn-helix transcriptional regulator [Rhodococcus pyridinivorans]|uniref:MarR family transcriptional regulator n=1 Tax=Rhodococcus pyridinivorans AK37 TaxID=1114960 RepID=H0JN41_9NOCA|nr:MarR family transcriptional regulator [Rhodococcus pyridinivorans AK37]
MSATHDAAGPDRLGHLPSYLMTLAARHVHRVVFDRLDSADARGHHYRILAALEVHGPSSQIDLARRCGLDRSDVAAAVDALVDRRFVERAPDPTDRRRNIITSPSAGAGDCSISTGCSPRRRTRRSLPSTRPNAHSSPPC